MPSAGEARVEISLETLEGDDDVLMSPCASARSASSAGEEGVSTWERGLEDAVTSSVESSWSMVSVDEIGREVCGVRGSLFDRIAVCSAKTASPRPSSEGLVSHYWLIAPPLLCMSRCCRFHKFCHSLCSLSLLYPLPNVAFVVRENRRRRRPSHALLRVAPAAQREGRPNVQR